MPYFGVRRQSAAATALWMSDKLQFVVHLGISKMDHDKLKHIEQKSKAPSPLRSAGALQNKA